MLGQAGARNLEVSPRARQAKRDCTPRAVGLPMRADLTEPARIVTSRIRCCVRGSNDDE